MTPGKRFGDGFCDVLERLGRGALRYCMAESSPQNCAVVLADQLAFDAHGEFLDDAWRCHVKGYEWRLAERKGAPAGGPAPHPRVAISVGCRWITDKTFFDTGDAQQQDSVETAARNICADGGLGGLAVDALLVGRAGTIGRCNIGDDLVLRGHSKAFVCRGNHDQQFFPGPARRSGSLAAEAGACAGAQQDRQDEERKPFGSLHMRCYRGLPW